MKALIWTCCLVGSSTLMVILEALGLPLGPLLQTILVSAAFALAIALCKRLPKKNTDEEPTDKNDNDEVYHED